MNNVHFLLWLHVTMRRIFSCLSSS